jgi:acylphosphatase
LDELEKMKTDLAAKDGDIKVAVTIQDKAVEEMKHLIGQIKGARASVVIEFQPSEVFEDNNTQYFLSGFKTFRM